MQVSEERILAFLREQAKQRGYSDDLLDDAAVLEPSPSSRIITTDMLLSGVHFDWPGSLPEHIGRKALAVNLSDLASCGARPEGFFLSLGIPKSLSWNFLETLLSSMLDLADQYTIRLMGGDTNQSRGGLVINITAIGSAHPQGIPRRTSARPGDAIGVTGVLGDTRQSHQFLFVPRLAEARFLLDHAPLHAMTDLSDGLASEIRHVATASGVGAQIYEDQIPIRESLKNLSNEESLKRALTDGEDFELLFTLSAKDWPELALKWQQHFPHTPLTLIGEVTKARGILLSKNGNVREMAWSGFSH
jgi:thiamine-monophosphate kinase